jgi:hypothetical protein
MKRFLALSLLLCSIAGAQSVTLTPSKDTDVYSFGNGGFPTSTRSTLGVNSTPLDSYPESHSQKSFIQFNTSGVTIPAAEVGKAVLRMFVLMPEPMYGTLTPGNVHVHVQESDWGAVTASTPKWAAFKSAGEIGTIPVLLSSAETWVELDITSTVVGWLNGTIQNHGVFLASQTEFMTPGINVSFASMEVPGYQPQLVITKKVVPPVLSIASNNGGVTLQWPVTGSTGWVLQRADSPAGPWVNNAATVSNSGGIYQLQPTMIGREFFRLAQQ